MAKSPDDPVLPGGSGKPVDPTPSDPPPTYDEHEAQAEAQGPKASVDGLGGEGKEKLPDDNAPTASIPGVGGKRSTQLQAARTGEEEELHDHNLEKDGNQNQVKPNRDVTHPSTHEKDSFERFLDKMFKFVTNAVGGTIGTALTVGFLASAAVGMVAWRGIVKPAGLTMIGRPGAALQSMKNTGPGLKTIGGFLGKASVALARGTLGAQRALYLEDVKKPKTPAASANTPASIVQTPADPKAGANTQTSITSAANANTNQSLATRLTAVTAGSAGYRQSATSMPVSPRGNGVSGAPMTAAYSAQAPRPVTPSAPPATPRRPSGGFAPISPIPDSSDTSSEPPVRRRSNTI